jgi:mannitol-specific phosphotransferase system IIBC component
LPEKDQTARRKNNSKHGKKSHTQKKKEQSRKSRKRAVKRNRKYVDAHKLINPCPCGETESCCLSFHHENGDKTGNISDMVNRGYGINRIQKEIDKCTVLCLNCHAKLHNRQREDKTLEVVESKL